MTTMHINASAESWTYTYATDVSLAQNFHQRLPGYETTPLIPLPSLATELGVKAVFAKDESSRFGLPAFKILGASWGAYRAIAAKTNLPLDSSLDKLSSAARSAGLSLFAATSGNHGRAIARMAKILGIRASIFLANKPDAQVLRNVASEGAEVVVVEGNYDDAVAEAARRTKSQLGGLHIQDYAWDGYDEIAGWVVEGYSTMLRESEQQLVDQGLSEATHIVTPVGAGTLALAVVAHAKSQGRHVSVVAVEPTTAACLHDNLRRGRLEPICAGSTTIMTGMICDNVNPIAWPVLRRGVDVSVTISDLQCHDAVRWLHAHGVDAGPCGAASLAGLREVIALDRGAAGLDEHSVIVLLCTEGKRYYRVPEAEEN